MSTLFDPSTLDTKPCTACGAIRTSGQTRVPTCAYDLQAHLELHARDWPRRPRTCLHTAKPTTDPLPEGF